MVLLGRKVITKGTQLQKYRDVMGMSELTLNWKVKNEFGDLWVLFGYLPVLIPSVVALVNHQHMLMQPSLICALPRVLMDWVIRLRFGL